MNKSELPETIALLSAPKELVSALQVSSYDDLPQWSDLVKSYDPMQHSIIKDLLTYPPKLNEKNQDEFKRTPLALQKLAVNRLSQSMFATHTQRQYDYDRDIEAEQKAVDVIETLYRVKNNIDAENIERAKKLHSSCQIATIWRAYEKPTRIRGEESKLSLTHKTYSPKDGYTLYPQVDEFGDLIVLSIEYTDTDDIDHFDVYVGGDAPMVIYLVNSGGWVLNENITENPKKLEFFPVVYGKVYEPAWGGDAGTIKVEQLEEMESFDGLYIKKNSAPAFTQDMGDTAGMSASGAEEKTDDARKIIRVGKGGKITDVSWTGAGDSLDKRINRLRNDFFEEIQIPDTSFANMIASNTSADNKELIFSDARQKAIDLGGEWISLFNKEIEIVIEFAKVMFPSLKTALENISVMSVIKPYSVRNKKDNAEYVATAGSAMSLKTKIRVLGEVSDVEQEAEQIEKENAQINTNFL